MINQPFFGLWEVSLSLFVHCQGRSKEQRVQFALHLSALATELGSALRSHSCVALSSGQARRLYHPYLDI